MADNNNKNTSVEWGKLGRNLVAGAAIVVGAIIVFPTLGGAIAAGIAGMGDTLLAAGSAGSTAPLASSFISTLVTKAIGLAAVYTGASYLMADGNSNDVAQSASIRRETDESFAAREDIRKMQAIMLARMQASGHQPAMAMANDRGRC